MTSPRATLTQARVNAALELASAASPAAARAHLEAALDDPQASADVAFQARALVADTWLHDGAPERALEVLLAPVPEGAAWEGVPVWAQLRAAPIRAKLGQPDAALEGLASVEDAAGALDPVVQALVRLEAAKLQLARGEGVAAMERVMAAFQTANATGQADVAAAACLLAAQVALREGATAEAWEYIQTGLDAWTDWERLAQDDPSASPLDLHEVGDALWLQGAALALGEGNAAVARQLMTARAQRLAPTPSPLGAFTEAWLAHAEGAPSADTLLRRALQTATQADDATVRARVLLLQAARADTLDARAALINAACDVAPNGSPTARAALTQRAQVALERADVAEADATLALLSVAHRPATARDQERDARLLARLAALTGDVARALTWTESALNAARARDDRDAQLRDLLALARLHRKRAEPARAATHLSDARALAPSSPNVLAEAALQHLVCDDLDAAAAALPALRAAPLGDLTGAQRATHALALAACERALDQLRDAPARLHEALDRAQRAGADGHSAGLLLALEQLGDAGGWTTADAARLDALLQQLGASRTPVLDHPERL